MTVPAVDGAPTGLYVHVPFCDGRCGYCAFYSVSYEERLARRWLEAVRREYLLVVEREGAPSFETVYIGGGTPTVLSLPLLEELLEWIRERTGGARVVEWSVEANPGSATFEKLAGMRDAGVTRLSLGVQALQEARLRWLGRRHTVAEAEAAYHAAREAGFRNVGVDLIAGGAYAGRREWRETLSRVVEWGPEHVSVYALTVEEGTALGSNAVWKGEGEEEEQRTVQRLHEAAEILEGAGYCRYEISNYARPGFACRHHVACWRGERYLGLGPSAASHVGMRRWTNRADLDDYLNRLEAGAFPAREEEELSGATKAVERLIFGLRMAEGVDLRVVTQEGGKEEKERWRTVLKRLGAGGLVEGGGDRWRLTPLGMDFADTVAVELML